MQIKISASEFLQLENTELTVAPEPDYIGRWMILCGDKVISNDFSQPAEAHDAARLIKSWHTDMLLREKKSSN